jgi:hypothetical protein
MSEFSDCQPSEHTRLILPLLPSIPFGKAVPADDDLFPPIRPPMDTTAPLKPDAAEEEEDTADADADAVTGDGSSDASEESDEVSSSVLKQNSSFEDEAQDIEFIMEPANRSLDLRCVARLLHPASPHLSLGQTDPHRATRMSRHKKV